jgi:hypothetical protein
MTSNALPSGAVYNRWAMTIYGFLTTIAMVNLLIAMLSQTYVSVYASLHSHPPSSTIYVSCSRPVPLFWPSFFAIFQSGPMLLLSSQAICSSHIASITSSWYAAFRHAEMETVSIRRRAAIYMEWVAAAPVRPPFNLLALLCDGLASVLAQIAIKLGLGLPPTDEELGQVDLILYLAPLNPSALESHSRDAATCRLSDSQPHDFGFRKT